MTNRTARPAARLLVVDAERRVLMFNFKSDAAASFWATPGGACDPGESYTDAARRELCEETGFDRDPGPEVAQRTCEFTTIEGGLKKNGLVELCVGCNHSLEIASTELASGEIATG